MTKVRAKKSRRAQRSAEVAAGPAVPPRAGGRRSRSRLAEQAAPLAEATVIDFGPLKNYLGYYLRRLYEAYRRHFLEVASELEFGPREVGAAFVIGLNPGLTPSQLRAALAMDGAQITALLNMFERRGFIDRRVSAADARSRHVFFTREGEALLDRLREVVGWFDHSFAASALDAQELAQLIRLLAKLYTSYESKGGAAPDMRFR